MKYIVSGEKRTTVSAEIEVEALTREEAVAKFKDQHPDLIPDHISALIDGDDGETEDIDECWSIVGFDEGNGSPIFDDEDYCHDEDGIMWHRDVLKP